MKFPVAQIKLFSLSEEQNTTIYPGNSHSHDKKVCAEFHKRWDEPREAGIEKDVPTQIDL